MTDQSRRFDWSLRFSEPRLGSDPVVPPAFCVPPSAPFEPDDACRVAELPMPSSCWLPRSVRAELASPCEPACDPRSPSLLRSLVPDEREVSDGEPLRERSALEPLIPPLLERSELDEPLIPPELERSELERSELERSELERSEPEPLMPPLLDRSELDRSELERSEPDEPLMPPLLDRSELDEPLIPPLRERSALDEPCMPLSRSLDP